MPAALLWSFQALGLPGGLQSSCNSQCRGTFRSPGWPHAAFIPTTGAVHAPPSLSPCSRPLCLAAVPASGEHRFQAHQRGRGRAPRDVPAVGGCCAGAEGACAGGAGASAALLWAVAGEPRRACRGVASTAPACRSRPCSMPLPCCARVLVPSRKRGAHCAEGSAGAVLDPSAAHAAHGVQVGVRGAGGAQGHPLPRGLPRRCGDLPQLAGGVFRECCSGASRRAVLRRGGGVCSPTRRSCLLLLPEHARRAPFAHGDSPLRCLLPSSRRGSHPGLCGAEQQGRRL